MTTESRLIVRRVLDALLFIATLAAVGASLWDEVPDWASLLVLSLFVFLFFLRCWYSDHRLTYLKSNWLDLALVVLLSSPLLRLFVVFKVAGLAPALRLGTLIRANRERLMKLVILSNDSFPVAMSLVFGIVFIFGATEYLLEHPHNPGFAEVSDGLWWAFVTLTTVGYGDLYPVTSAGRIVAVFTMLFGITIYSLMIANLTYYVGETGRKRRELLEAQQEATASVQADEGERPSS
ncbi:MAG: potassium channel family protein [Mariprofundaceae bacterium]|nr:potassium channel family protein [Mariprofundaceae bacterium]